MSSAWAPIDVPVARLRALGASAASLHRIAVPDGSTGLPSRHRPIAGVDFDRLRAEAPRQELLARGEEVMRTRSVADESTGLVHGDLWQGNALWAGNRLVALIDWDCAGVGPAGVDLGSVRCDAALYFGLDAAEHVSAGWEAEAGRPAERVAYWDVVAALSTPPDMGWFVDVTVDQGRPDLTRELLVARRDEFLATALDRLQG